MATPVEAPKLGNTVEECLVAKWLKRKGDPVSAGETVVEIETDKATFEVVAPVAGTLIETFFAKARWRGLHQPLRHWRAGRKTRSPSAPNRPFPPPRAGEPVGRAGYPLPSRVRLPSSVQ